MIRRKPHLCVVLFVLSALATRAEAAIVKMEVFLGASSAGDIFIELFDSASPGRSAAPVTVANFLNYIDDGNGNRRYDGTFLHRSVPGFVIQGGGFKYDPDLGAFSSTTAPHIATDAPIVNEFDATRSNVRGTIAMAKLGGNPDSATSEWFFNLADNASNLDSQNGGFTVFGQVLGNGMSVVDSIENLPISNQGGAFSSLPVVNFSQNPVTTDNLVTVTMTQSPYPLPLFLAPAPVDFGLTLINQIPSAQQQVLIVNTGATSLSIGTPGSVDALAAPFSIVAGSDTCSNQTLASFASCTLDISFDPQTSGTLFQDSLDIPFNDGAQKSITLNVSGTGAFTTPTLETSPASALDFGTVAVADFSEKEIVIRNTGQGSLQLDSVNVSGTDASDFTLASESPTGCSSAALAFLETCRLTLRYTANSIGNNKTAVITVTASPGAQSIPLSLVANAIASQADILVPADTTINLGDTRSDLPATRTVSFQNQGAEDLIFTGLTISGADAGQFAISNTGCQRVTPNNNCTETVTFTPSGTGTRTATLDVLTNDPDTPVLNLTLTATSSTDNDGVPDAIESAGPNAGDGNFDNIPDVQQENVTSLPDIHGNYATLETPPGILLTGVTAIDNPAPSTTPTVSDGTVAFPHGFYSFTLKGLAPGGSTTVTYHLPSGAVVNSFFKFGFPSQTSIFAQWYQFLYDGTTGAEFSGPTVTLHFVDGGRGDSDRNPANGEILDPGGPALISAGSSSSGGGCTLKSGQDPEQPVRLDAGMMLLFMLLLGRIAMPPGIFRKSASVTTS